MNGNAKTLAMLLEAGADASSANGDGETALMAAARTGTVDAVNLLLARGADPNTTEGWRGQTALMWAAAEGHDAVIRVLIARGADLKARSNAGFTALLFAARGAFPPSTRCSRPALISTNRAGEATWSSGRRAADGGPNGQSRPAPAKWASTRSCWRRQTRYELAAMLLDRGADPNAAPQGYTALHQVSWVRKAGIAGSNNPAPQGSGSMDSLTFVRAGGQGRADQRARHQTPEHGCDDAQFDWRDAIPARRAHGRCAAHEGCSPSLAPTRCSRMTMAQRR